MLTYSQRKTFNRRGSQEIDRTVKAAVEAQREAEREARAGAYPLDLPLVPYTADELKAATHIRTDLGWHRVVRVNAKSVTVETGYSWNDRYPLDKILQVAHA